MLFGLFGFLNKIDTTLGKKIRGMAQQCRKCGDDKSRRK